MMNDFVLIFLVSIPLGYHWGRYLMHLELKKKMSRWQDTITNKPLYDRLVEEKILEP